MNEKLLVVCGTGMGSSMILKMMVDQVVGAQKLPFDVSSDLASSARSSGADVIVAGLDLAPPLTNVPATVIGIKNILDKAEIASALEDYLAFKSDGED